MTADATKRRRAPFLFSASFLIAFVAFGCRETSRTVNAPLHAVPETAEPAKDQTTPAPTVDSWQGLDALQSDKVVKWSAAQPNSFATPDHVKLVAAAGKCSEALASAQWRQDVLLQFDASAHFDNCAFKPTLEYVASLLAGVGQKMKIVPVSESDVNEAMGLLGRAVHAIQDFYSHSNYVELMASKGVKFDEDLVIPVWTPAGAAQVLTLAKSGGLVSGRVWWDGPKLCADSVPSHGELAKDDDKMPSGSAVLPNWNYQGYRAARQLANWATIQFLGAMYARWPVLRTTCGPVVHFLPAGDNRPQR